MQYLVQMFKSMPIIVPISYTLITPFVALRIRAGVNIINWKFRLLSADEILLCQIYSSVKCGADDACGY